MPNVITPNSQSMPQPDQAGMMGGQMGKDGKPGIPPGKPGGDIMISQAEAIALTALETDDPKVAHHRARAESGMTHNQILKLKARAARARAAGFTLKGGNLTLRPTNHATDTPLGHGLATERKDGIDDEDETPEGFTPDKPAKKAAAKKTKEAADAMLEAAYFHLVQQADRSVEDELREMWSDAARAAAAANRRGRSKKPQRDDTGKHVSGNNRFGSEGQARRHAGTMAGRAAYLKAGGKASDPGAAFKRGSKKATKDFDKVYAADEHLDKTIKDRGALNSKTAMRQADSASAKAWNTQASASNATVTRQRSRFEGVSDRAAKVPKSQLMSKQKLSKTYDSGEGRLRIRKGRKR